MAASSECLPTLFSSRHASTNSRSTKQKFPILPFKHPQNAKVGRQNAEFPRKNRRPARTGFNARVSRHFAKFIVDLFQNFPSTAPF
jgi:hypothetical protein